MEDVETSVLHSMVPEAIEAVASAAMAATAFSEGPGTFRNQRQTTENDTKIIKIIPYGSK